MFNSPILESIVAITVTLLIYSSIVSLMVEWVNNLNVRQKRQMYLYLSIRKALDEPQGINWGSLLYLHPHVRALKSEARRYPAYISAATFADTLLAVLREHYFTTRTIVVNHIPRLPVLANNGDEFKLYQDIIKDLDDGEFKRLMTGFLIISGEKKLEGLQNNIKAWFNNYQDRVTGEYKKSIRKDLRWFGITLALILNLNIFHIGLRIFSDKDLRQSLVGVAEKSVHDKLFQDTDFTCKGCTDDEYEERYRLYLALSIARADSLRGVLKTSGLPMGWSLPKSSREINVEFLEQDIEQASRLLRDTVRRLRTRYCYIKSLLPSTPAHVHALTVDLISADSLTQDSVVAYAKKFKIDVTPSTARYVAHFLVVPIDSVKEAACRPDAAMRTGHTACLEDCSQLDLTDMEAAIEESIHNRIAEDEMELSVYDELYQASFVQTVKERIHYFRTIPAYNIRSPRELITYLAGAIVMGLLASVGSTAWFEILLRLFQLRNTGVRPKKEE
ncbi:hypothetical protein [Parachryseolinea silvisoli]|uniref:hypothetical protein n=1 Tax=Parachryseolinea silvisoli TaxID=2873601 RepID=UPI0022659356|nr:hypothetical protein [Parachryseolinea silvisoli]MCD9018774.1 hypothetical protein [Parachryseolinea silvisoli]